MVKREDSLRSQGFTTMALGAPVKARLKAQAIAKGFPTLAEYVKYLADKSDDGQQGAMIPTPQAVAISELNKKMSDLNVGIEAICRFFRIPQATADKINSYFPPREVPDGEIAETVKAFKYLYEQGEDCIKQLRFKDGDQECQGETQ